MEAQLLTDEKVEEAFEDDWVKMDNPVFQVRAAAGRPLQCNS
jgi:hypothetical protein